MSVFKMNSRLLSPKKLTSPRFSREPFRSREYKTGIYQGEFSSDSNHWREGQGVFYWLGGQIYIGSWQKDQIEGNGRVYFPYGGTFEGYFKANKANGIGILRLRDGSVYAVEYLGGILIEISDKDQSKAMRIYSEIREALPKVSNVYLSNPLMTDIYQIGIVKLDTDFFYEGVLRGTRPDGIGIMLEKKELFSARGRFANTKLFGAGRIELENGEIYDGFFRNGLFKSGIYYNSHEDVFIQGNFKGSNPEIITKGKGYPYQLFANSKENLFDCTLVYKSTCSEVIFPPPEDRHQIREFDRFKYVSHSLSRCSSSSSLLSKVQEEENCSSLNFDEGNHGREVSDFTQKKYEQNQQTEEEKLQQQDQQEQEQQFNYYYVEETDFERQLSLSDKYELAGTDNQYNSDITQFKSSGQHKYLSPREDSKDFHFVEPFENITEYQENLNKNNDNDNVVPLQTTSSQPSFGLENQYVSSSNIPDQRQKTQAVTFGNFSEQGTYNYEGMLDHNNNQECYQSLKLVQKNNNTINVSPSIGDIQVDTFSDQKNLINQDHKSEHFNENEPFNRRILKIMSCKEQQKEEEEEEESVENYFNIMELRHNNDITSMGTISAFNESASEVKFGNKSKAEEDSSLLHIFEEPSSPPERNFITLKKLMMDSSILYLDPELTNNFNGNNNNNINETSNAAFMENSQDNQLIYLSENHQHNNNDNRHIQIHSSLNNFRGSSSSGDNSAEKAFIFEDNNSFLKEEQ